jgi:CheY-like chemotaxis protein
MTTNAKILVVDDAGPVLVLCVNVLQAMGHAIRTATGGEAALELVRQEPFDLLLVDYKMPGMNGFEVVERARAIRPELVFVLMTAHGSPEIKNDAARLGFSGFLGKPFTPSELRGAVATALERGR